MMEGRATNRDFARDQNKLSSSMSLQKKLSDSRRPVPIVKPKPAPDLTDFMNDMFFGTVSPEMKAYDLTGKLERDRDHQVDDFDSSTRSNSSRMTQAWLEEARQIVATSPGRSDSPSRLVGSPRFAAAAQGRLSASSPKFDRRDPLSRSARRNRAVDSFSGEILSKSVRHGRNRSETLDTPPDSPTDPSSPAESAHNWFSNNLKSPNANDSSESRHSISSDQPPQLLPPRQSTHRRSRFQNNASTTQAQEIPAPPRRFRTPTPSQDTQLLSPPKNLVESSHRRSLSSSTCTVPDDRVLSPPRSLVESAHRRSLSSSTCSLDKIVPKATSNGCLKKGDGAREVGVNGFLREQRSKIGKIFSGEINARAKIVLSGPSNSTSSMIAAICYAWLLENRMNNNKGEVNGGGYIAVPMMNVRRAKMWKQRQAAWLFHHVSLDGNSLLFADEVDLESLMMAGKLSILVVGQDVLKTNGEVGSQCTVLTDNYCEEAYDLLETEVLRKLLLAGILLDTQNLNATSKLSTTRDAEAVQLLLVGSAPNYRNTLFDQLMQDPQDSTFTEAMQQNYGKPPNGNSSIAGSKMDRKVPERKSTSVHSQEGIKKVPETNQHNAKTAKTERVSPKPDKQSPKPVQPPKKASNEGRGKNTFFLARWFGFGPK